MAEPLDLDSPSIHPEAFVASTARLYGSVEIHRQAVVMDGVVVRAELDRVVIGEQSNLQDNVVVHCDAGFPAVVGRRVTVGHTAVVHGATVGDHCLVGIGALVLNGAVMGEGSWLAAGSVLTEGKEVPPWTLAVGTPAEPSRRLRPDEIVRQDQGVEEYLRMAAAYRAL